MNEHLGICREGPMHGLKLYATSPVGHFDHGEYVWKPTVWRGGVWLWRAKPPEWGWVPSDIPYALPRGKWQDSYMEYIRTTIPRGTWDRGPSVPYNRKPKMTRDEAIEIAKQFWGSPDRAVDTLVALGVLKLDEPKHEVNRFIDLVAGYGMKLTEQDAENIWALVHRNGLRIVPK